MKIFFANRNEIDSKRWDETLANSSLPLVYANSEYLDIVSPNWSALISDDYNYIFPLPTKKKYSVNYIIQPLLTQQLGLFSYQEIERETLQKFLNSISKKYKYVNFNLNTDNFFDEKYKFINKNYELKIDDNIGEIRNNYSNNLKRNLKVAENSNLKIVENTDIKDIINLFKKHNEVKLKNFNNNIYQKLSSLCSYKNKPWNIRQFAALNKNDEIIAGMVIIEFLERAIFIFSGNSDEGKLFKALPYLIDWYIASNSNKIKIFDFEGSNNEGLARFYSSFGACKKQYQVYKKTSFLIGLFK